MVTCLTTEGLCLALVDMLCFAFGAGLCLLIFVVSAFCGINNNNNYNNTKFVKSRVAMASEAVANSTAKKHRRRRTNVL